MRTTGMTRQCRRVLEWLISGGVNNYQVTPRAIDKCLKRGYITREGDKFSITPVGRDGLVDAHR